MGHPLALVTRTFEENTTRQLRAFISHPKCSAPSSSHPSSNRSTSLSKAPRWHKRGLYRDADRFFLDPYITPSLNAFRAELGLPPVRRVFHSWLHSPRLTIGIFPDWFAPPHPDWPPQTRTTGFILYDDAESWYGDSDIEDFIAAGDPPIVFTPGSNDRQAPGFFEAAVKAVDRLGRRALLLTDTRDSCHRIFPTACVTRPMFRSRASCHTPLP